MSHLIVITDDPPKRGISRRKVVLSGLACTAMIGKGTATTADGTSGGPVQEPKDPAEWNLFRKRFVRDGQRVIDDGNRGISHSEGQGIGMLAAAVLGGEAEFAGLRAWTRDVLQCRHDALHAWRYDPAARDPVHDRNSATDGDMLIAYALFVAAGRWGRPDYRASAQQIVRDLGRRVVREGPAGAILMPGAEGFLRRGEYVVNPSYYVFPALDRFVAEGCDPVWQRVRADGLHLLRSARFGAWGLPADWVSISRMQRRYQISDGWPPRFSYDAVRVPLYLAWSGLRAEPAVESAVRFWSKAPNAPAWVNLRTNGVSPYRLHHGMAAIRDFVQQPAGSAETGQPRSVAQAANYYDAALTLLVHIAAEHRPPPRLS